jgi:acyl-CoA synthetase (NDP forming)
MAGQNCLESQMDSIFYPKTTAIIGATNRAGSFGRLFLEGFLRMGYKEIFPIHPREKELLGLKAYPSVKDVPQEIDLAILLTPPEQAPKIVQECADKHVKAILVFTAGFREKGETGRQAELELVEITRKGGSRLIGPNSNGFYSPQSHLLTLPGSLTAGGLTTESGALSVFSHSGSFNDYLSQVLVGKNVRFSKVVSCGNEADLSTIDFLEYFGADRRTAIIAGYLEGIKNGKRFFELAKSVSKRKPIVIWKGGSTETGAKAALAHTGSLAGSKQVWDAMFKQTGIVQVNSFEEMVDTLLAFSWLPLPAGGRVAIVSGMGGTNVGTADNCVAMGLEMAKFSEGTLSQLSQILPALGTAASNPVDVGVGMLLAPQIYGDVLRLLAEDENVDMLIAITAPEASVSVQSIASAKENIRKPIAVALFDTRGLVEAQVKFLLEQHIPAYFDARRAASALCKLAEYAKYRNKG